MKHLTTYPAGQTMETFTRSSLLITVVNFLLLMMRPATSLAAIWSGGTDGSWTNGANWVGGSVPAPGENSYFISIPVSYSAPLISASTSPLARSLLTGQTPIR
jgi:hypothetical protein